MTITVKEPEVAIALHERVEGAEVVEPPRVTLVGVRVHVSPLDGDTLEPRETVPGKPSSADTVTVDDPPPPEKTSKLVGLAETEKS